MRWINMDSNSNNNSVDNTVHFLYGRYCPVPWFDLHLLQVFVNAPFSERAVPDHFV